MDIELRLQRLEHRLDSLVQTLDQHFLQPGKPEGQRDTQSIDTSPVHHSTPALLPSPYQPDEYVSGFVLSAENQLTTEAAPYTAWAWLLSKRVIIKEQGYRDTNPISWVVVKDLEGTIKAVAISDTSMGVTADVSVEFYTDLPMGHDCLGTCLPHRGLWFSLTHVMVIGENNGESNYVGPEDK